MNTKVLLIPVFVCLVIAGCVSDNQNGQHMDSLSTDSAYVDSLTADSSEVNGVLPDSTRIEAPVH
jgi:outer membrane murein-binding lipoprotein Lpp